MTKLERYEKALEKAMAGLESAGYTVTLAEVKAILNPPPAVVTEEVTAYAVFNPQGEMVALEPTNRLAEAHVAGAGAYQIIPLQGTLTREVQKAERSATAACVKWRKEGELVVPTDASWVGDIGTWPDLIGKIGTLTFTWGE